MTYHQISNICSKKWYLISQRNEFSFRFWTDRETSVTKIRGICEQCKEKESKNQGILRQLVQYPNYYYSNQTQKHLKRAP